MCQRREVQYAGHFDCTFSSWLAGLLDGRYGGVNIYKALVLKLSVSHVENGDRSEKRSIPSDPGPRSKSVPFSLSRSLSHGWCEA